MKSDAGSRPAVLEAVAAVRLKLECRLCHDVLLLNPDSDAAREAGTDPRQQMRAHIYGKHLGDAIAHARQCGWLVDMLMFDSLDDPERWRGDIAAVVDWILKERAT